MHQYQQMDLQALIDMLAHETQEYTKAFTKGEQEEAGMRRTVMESLIFEIRRRKKEDILPHNVLDGIRPPEQPDTA